jgi:5-methylcytosine-specific restriction endonuclease McrA
MRLLLDAGVSLAEVARRTGIPYTVVRDHRERIRGGQQLPGETPLHAPAPHASTGQEIGRLLRAGCSRAEVARRLDISRGTVTYHARILGMAVDKRAARRYDWSVVQAYYDAGHSVSDCVAHFGFSNKTWHDAMKRGAIRTRPHAMPIEELLAAPRARGHLKKRLLKAGLLPSHCQECGLEDWRGRRIALELHHINGDGKDNRLENLALLCPNCHSQTDSWGGRNCRRGPLRSRPAARSARSTP